MAIGVVLSVYGVITAVGGLLGYLKVKSWASLIAGVLCGADLLTSGTAMFAGKSWGFWAGLTVNLFLVVVFGLRYAKTKSVMPAGVMLGISVIVAGILVTEI